MSAPPPPPRVSEAEIELLRALLLRTEQQKLAAIETQLAELDARTRDKEALIAMLAPLLAAILRTAIRKARAEVIEALYPIIGELVARAVSEAMREFSRSIDARMRRSLNFRELWEQWRASWRGVSKTALALRQALPFHVEQVFLIHRETGLLLAHRAHVPENAADLDLVSSMLTAIRDFAAQTLRQGADTQLDEIQYGEFRIVIEATTGMYLAVVLRGVEPQGFRAALRERLLDLAQRYSSALEAFDGDVSIFRGAGLQLRTILHADAGRPLTRATEAVE